MYHIAMLILDKEYTFFFYIDRVIAMLVLDKEYTFFILIG